MRRGRLLRCSRERVVARSMPTMNRSACGAFQAVSSVPARVLIREVACNNDTVNAGLARVLMCASSSVGSKTASWMRDLM